LEYKSFFSLSLAANAHDAAAGKLKTIAAASYPTSSSRPQFTGPAQLSSISMHLVSEAFHNNAARCTFYWLKCLVEPLIKSTGETETLSPFYYFKE
jgi:hypothetical protein